MAVKKKRLKNYFKIYGEIYENPSISWSQIRENTGISRSSVYRYLKEMYSNSIMQGPSIFVKPAENYLLCASFCVFRNPCKTYKRLGELPNILFRSLNCGEWNITLTSDRALNFSVLKNFRTCIFQDAKSVTYLPRVTSLNWNQSMERIYTELSPPKEKTSLYEEMPPIPWGVKEWKLFHAFKKNTRVQTLKVVKKCHLRYETFQKWFSELPQVAHIYPAFYPEGIYNYFSSDFLFQSDYHHQLSTILGLLPSTSIFFSVGDYLFARLFVLNKKEEEDLFSLIFMLKEKSYITGFHFAKSLYNSEEVFH